MYHFVPTRLKLTIGFVLILALFFSCQRQLHFDIFPADGVLEKDVLGNCMPVTVGGTFHGNKELADSNFIVVQVNVKTTGTFSISTDTVNGYSFKAAGKFDHTGSTSVKMQGKGKPIKPGGDQFTVRFNNSTCFATVKIDEGEKAAFSFSGAPDRCRGAVVLGEYKKDNQLGSSNIAKIEVSVNTPGYYSISSNLLNGYQFSGSGYFANPGVQTIVLTAAGTPINPGIDVFTISSTSSSCTIVDTVKDEPGTDHFPITRNNKWIYDDLIHIGDSVTRKIVDSIQVNGFSYKTILEQDKLGTRNVNVRRTGDQYYDWGLVDRFTNSTSYSTQVFDTIPFLKEAIYNNQSWISPTYSGNDQFGQTILIRYTFLCTNNNATTIVSNMLFQQVCEIRMLPQIASVGGSFNNTGEAYDLYYANRIGLIYFRKTLGGVAITEWTIRRWEVY